MNLDETESRKWLQIELEEGDCAELDAAIRWALVRIAELEAGEVRTEWGVQYGPGDVDNLRGDEDFARHDAADPTSTGVLVTRVIRHYPWTTTSENTP